MTSEFKAALRAAAAIMGYRSCDESAAPLGQGVLHHLGVSDHSELTSDTFDPADRADFARLLDFAATLEALFEAPVPDAPGMIFYGGTVTGPTAGGSRTTPPRTHVAGAGLARHRAFRACVAEAAEFVSQFETPEDRQHIVETAPGVGLEPAETRHFNGLAATDSVQRWIIGQRLRDQSAISVPADLCLRTTRPDEDHLSPGFNLGVGCAAGRSFSEATLTGLLEIIERDAVALWWRGGTYGRPIDRDSLAESGVAALLSKLRQGGTDRKTWFVDITTDLGVPVVAALSTTIEGTQFAYGFAARHEMRDALPAALFELGQMELSAHFLQAKIDGLGAEALNDTDRMHQRRLDVPGNMPLLLPTGSPAANSSTAISSQGPLTHVVDHCVQQGYEPFVVDLTRSTIGIPVARVLVPGLQPDPGGVETERLVAVRALPNGFKGPRPQIV